MEYVKKYLGWKAGELVPAYAAWENAEVGKEVPWKAVLAMAAMKGYEVAKMAVEMGGYEVAMAYAA